MPGTILGTRNINNMEQMGHFHENYIPVREDISKFFKKANI